MIYADRVLHDRQVMHRHHVASLCSRATLMRRLREGRWWRPTDWTVAVRTEFPDSDFDLLVASAHVWPDGGIGGLSLPYLFSLGPAPSHIEVSVPHARAVDGSTKFAVHRRRTLSLASYRLSSGREITLDFGPGSLDSATAGMKPAIVAWLLVRCQSLSPTRESRASLLADCVEWQHTQRRPDATMIRSIAAAVAGGCESAGEVYVWHLLQSLGVRFRAQREINLGGDARTAIGSRHIRVDFILEGDVILEVDSGLHQHLKDVRRDLWNLTAGRRTLRVVGTDVISDPVHAQTQLAKALKHLGIRVNLQPLPAWLTAQ